MPSDRKANATVLVVEDEPAVRELVCEILQRSNYSVLKAKNAEEALQIAQEAKRPIEVVLTDLVMPGVNGIELARRLREQQPNIKVVLMSGYSQGILEEQSEPGMALLEKPFTATTLLEQVRAVVEPSDS